MERTSRLVNDGGGHRRIGRCARLRNTVFRSSISARYANKPRITIRVVEKRVATISRMACVEITGLPQNEPIDINTERPNGHGISDQPAVLVSAAIRLFVCSQPSSSEQNDRHVQVNGE